MASNIEQREREIREKAYFEYDEEYVSNPDYMTQIRAFTDGAHWADIHPSDEMLGKVAEIVYRRLLDEPPTDNEITMLVKHIKIMLQYGDC